jgi:hypothetical protein
MPRFRVICHFHSIHYTFIIMTLFEMFEIIVGFVVLASFTFESLFVVL